MFSTKDKILITGGSGFIGTNLVSLLIKENIDFLNIDKSKPKIEFHIKNWIKEDIINNNEIKKIFQKYQPTVIIHLAARTDTASSNIDDYFENTVGTRNIIEAIKETKSIERVIITSSQYVFFPKNYQIPKNDTDFCPHTIYGESKVLTEMYIRDANLDCIWTIIRPTNVWGPWNMRYPNELIKMIHQRLYLHPGKQKVLKSYAYVKNVTLQIVGIVKAERSIVDKKVFYVGDNPMDSYQWINSFSKQLTNKNVFVIPRLFIRILAKIGDILGIVNIKFPLTSLRYLNMTKDYITPMENTITEFGLYSDSISSNVRETIEWLYGEGNSYFPYWKKQKESKEFKNN